MAPAWADQSPAAAAALIVMAAGLAAGYTHAVVGGALLVAGQARLAGRRRGPDAGRAARCVWAAVGAAIGAGVLLAIAGARAEAVQWAVLAAEGSPLAIEGEVRVTAVRTLESGESGGSGESSGSGRWSARGVTGECAPACHDVAVRWLGRGDAAPIAGARWRVRGQLVAEPLRAPPGSRFPPPGLAPGSRRGALDQVRVLARREPRLPLLVSAGDHLRRRIRVRFGPALAPLVAALLLGDRGELDPALNDAFATTGTIHILSVSGLHVGFLAGLLSFCLGLAGAAPRQRAVAAIAILAGYTALTGASAPVVRSAIMCGGVLWAAAGERRTSLWQVWGAAAVALLAWRPLDLFDLGFILSFGALAGLLAATAPLEELLGAAQRRDASLPALAWRAIAANGVATVASTLATLPIQAAAFGWIAPVGLLANPVAVPVSAAGLPLAWLALTADALGVGVLSGPLTRAAAVALGGLGAVVADLGTRAGVWVPGPGGWLLGAVLLGTGAVALARHRPGRGCGVAAAGLALVLAARPADPPRWEVVWLDVGQGDAIVIHFPDGAAWLVDAGPADDWGDAGRRVILPYLRRRGVGELERLVTTHPHLDHVGGAASVVRGVRVRRWASGGFVDDSPAYLDLLAARGPAGAPTVERLAAGDRLRQGNVAIDILHPAPGWIAADPYGSRISINDGSVIMLLSRGPCRLLLTGDAGAPVERALVVALRDSLRAGLLHAGHHGSRHGTTRAFLARVQPAQAIASAGRANRHGHPHAETIARLEDAGARLWRTDRLGSIRAHCTARGWHLRATGGYF
ncbi:MAG: ComEC/Rec2 family competence protein [Gemmatimonadota bacterium]